MAGKKKNPQDATLRNIRALKKRVEALEHDFIIIVNLIVKSAKKAKRSKKTK